MAAGEPNYWPSEPEFAAWLRNLPESASSSHDIGERSDSREADGCNAQPRPQSPDPSRRTGISEESLLVAVGEVKRSVRQFARTRVSDMVSFSDTLKPLKRAICRDLKADMDKKFHWKYLVQAFVCKHLFADFETANYGLFGVDHFDGIKMSRVTSTEDYQDRDATISALLAQDSADDSILGKFCFQKFKLITRDVSTNRPFPIYLEDWNTVASEQHPNSDFYKSFLEAAVSVWLLHRCVHSSQEAWKLLGWETYPPGSKFQEEFMFPIPHQLLGVESMDMVVGIVVCPGFQVNGFIIKCKFYPTSIPSRHGGSLADDTRLHLPVVSNQDASSSHGDGNAMESSSPELTSSSTWSSSGAFTKPSEPIQTNNGSSISSAGGRPHEEHELSPPRDSSRSSPSGTMQDGPSVYKPSTDSIIEDNVKKYTWDQVLRMTNGATSRRLGKGGFGTVSLGKLENGKEVAVKILDRITQQGAAQFLNEVNLLNRVHHKNLVRLLGYCQDEQQVLIYEFAEQGSIWDHLHGDRQWLDWRQRLNIALESACGLEYLHNLCSPRIIHRDIKSENILLTKTWTVKVADFGLSRFNADEDNNSKTHVTTKVMGTRGYLDPEYYLTGQLRDSSDVYSFGVVLLEIITGRKPVPNSDPSCCIGNWVEKTYGSGGSRALKAVADPLFSNNYDPRALKLVMQVARSCIQSSGESRPNIAEVVRLLRKAQALELQEKKTSRFWFLSL